MKPVLFVTGHAPPDRVGAFAALHEREEIEVALFGGRSKHGGGEFVGELPFPHRYIRQHEPARLAASGRLPRGRVLDRRPCRAGGDLGGSAAWAGAADPVGVALGAPPQPGARVQLPALRRLYRSADAVVTYGPHVSAYVRARGARNVHVAPQAVDNDFWSAPSPPSAGPPAAQPAVADRSRAKQAGVKFLFAGRPGREKGVGVLLEAWRRRDFRHPPPRSSSSAWDRSPPGSRPPARWACPASARRARTSRAPARDVCRRRCPGGALDQHPHVPRAMGPGHQRGDEPGAGGDRQRRRRCSRGRPGARRCTTGWS